MVERTTPLTIEIPVEFNWREPPGMTYTQKFEPFLLNALYNTCSKATYNPDRENGRASTNWRLYDAPEFTDTRVIYIPSTPTDPKMPFPFVNEGLFVVPLKVIMHLCCRKCRNSWSTRHG